MTAQPGPAARRSPVARSAEHLLERTLFLWPDESREWGRALAAEAAQIDGPIEAVRWALGGLLFFLRSVGAHFFAWTKLPAGANSPSTLLGNEPPLLPKHSRLATATLILSAVVLLLSPWGREAVATVREVWLSGDVPDTRQIESLAKQAERERDAQLLAFAALSHPDSARGMQLASAAVSRDPSLTWIYTNDFFPRPDREFPDAWLDALRHYDPQNGYPFLTAANCRAQAVFYALVNRHTPQDGELDQLLEGDTQWRQLMSRAVVVPKYDDYVSRRDQFSRQVWASHPALPPGLVLHSLWSFRFPEILFLRSYAKLQIQDAQQLAARGDSLTAERSLNELLAFGDRLAGAKQADIERLGGMEVSRDTLLALRSLYVRDHRAADVRSVDQSLEELQHRRDSLIHWYGSASLASLERYQRPALGVLLSALLLLVIALALAASLTFLEASPFLPRSPARFFARVACLLADYAPLLLAVVAVCLLVSFHPFAAAIAQFRAGTGPLGDHRNFARVYFELGRPFALLFSYFSGPFFWWAVTIALSLLAVVITVRGFARRPALPRP